MSAALLASLLVAVSAGKDALAPAGRRLRAAGAAARRGLLPGSPPEVRVLDGGRGWRGGEEVESARLASMLLQAARLDLPALLSAWTVPFREENFANGRTTGETVLEEVEFPKALPQGTFRP